METRQEVWETYRTYVEQFVALQENKSATFPQFAALEQKIRITEAKLAAMEKVA